MVSPVPEPSVLLATRPREADQLEPQLRTWGFHVCRADNPAVARASLTERVFDLAIVGLDVDTAVVEACHGVPEPLPVLFLADEDADDDALNALKEGAFQVIRRPLNIAEMRVVLDAAIEAKVRETAHHELVREVKDRYDFESMVGRSAVMRRVFDLIQRIADSPTSVLITGESGTGKELIARAIHFRGLRADQPFVPINCAAIPGSLLESELFGYERGAFTGASRARAGLFVQSAGGTLFLDEIAEMSMELQPKLLRALQEGEVRAVGADQSRKINVRVIAATNMDLDQAVRERTFRQDLYYRLNVVPVEVPALRDRVVDIPILAERFLERAREANPRVTPTHIAPEAVELLLKHDWPGNVRELENVIHRAATLCATDTIDIADLRFLEQCMPTEAVEELFQGQPSLHELEERYIEYVLKGVGGNRVRACSILQIDPSTLYRRSKRARSHTG